MKYILVSFILVSCNVIQTITQEETNLSDDFFNQSSNNQNSNDTLFNDLVSFYRFENGSLGDDLMGLNPLLSVGGTFSSTPGNKGDALNCAGATSAITFKNTALNSDMNFGTTANFSISFWIYKTANGTTFQVPFDIHTTSSTILRSDTGMSEQLGISISAANLRSTSSAIVLNNWEHYVMVVDRTSGYQIYKNGSLVNGNATDTTGFNINSDELIICARFTAGTGSSAAFFEGKIDSLGFWRRTLSASEISDLYNGTNNLD